MKPPPFLPILHVVTWLTAVLYSPQIKSQARLTLNGATVTLSQGAQLVIENPTPAALVRTSGHIVSEDQQNNIKWHIGISEGIYIVPWGYGGTYMPLMFSTSNATGDGYILFSTYHTANWNNSAELPADVSNFTGPTGVDQSPFAVDRFWQINALGYTIKPTLSSLTFTYRDDEYNAVGNLITESALRPLRWNSVSSTWNDLITTPTVNTADNTVTMGMLAAADLYPWWTLSSSGLNRYWIASTASVWESAANWSFSSGGPGGAGIPQPWDVVSFDAQGDGMCTVNTAVTIDAMDVKSTYQGTIIQGTGSMFIRRDATFSGGGFRGGGPLSVGRDFTLDGSVFTSTNDTLTIGGDFILESGEFNHNDGTVKFSGTEMGSTQYIRGSMTADLSDVYISATQGNPGVSLEADLNLYGVLTLAPQAILDADGVNGTGILTVRSLADDPTSDGAIAALPTGARVHGNVTVQRHMTIEGPNNTRIYRYIASSVKNAAAVDLQQEIPVTGPFSGSSTCRGCTTNPSMFQYDEPVTTDTNLDGRIDLEDGYSRFPTHTNIEIIQPGVGYAVFVRANLLTTPVWDVRGEINTGNVVPANLPTSYTSSGEIANDGWNLVGNPFPSTIDWEASGWTRDNLEHPIYIRDNDTGAGQVAVWNGAVGVNGGSRYIALGQAFWVKADGNGIPLLQASEAVKAPHESTTFFREKAADNLIRMTLLHGTEKDESVVHFRNDASPEFDKHADAWKLKGASFSFSTLSDQGHELTINSWGPLACKDSIRLSITGAMPGTYRLQFSGQGSFAQGVTTELRDRYLHSSKVVSEGDEYVFTVGGDSATTLHDRFVLTVRQSVDKIDIQVTGNMLSVEKAGFTQWYFDGHPIAGATGSTLLAEQPGIYEVRINNLGCQYTGLVNMTVLSTQVPEQGLVKVYPNPVEDLLVFVTPQTIGQAKLSLIDPLGKVYLEKVVNGGGTLALTDLPKGVYFLQLTSKDQIFLVKVLKK
jgi:hypothetical protein